MFRPPDVENLRKNRDVRGLLKALTYKRSAEIRAQAARVIANALWLKSGVDGIDIIGPLTTSAKDPDPGVRNYSLKALGRYALLPSLEIFIAALKDEDLEVRSSAVDCLASFKGPEKDERAFQVLLGLLDDKEARIRWRGARSLGKLGDTRAVDALIHKLQDTSPDVRSSAAGALGTLGDRRAIEPLLPLLHDGKRWVRLFANSALIQLGEEGQTIDCDLCNSPITLRDISVYELEEFRAMVANGLEPPEGALKHALLMGIPQQAAIDQWRNMVFQENTAWNLCPACEDKARPYHQVLDPSRDAHQMV